MLPDQTDVSSSLLLILFTTFSYSSIPIALLGSILVVQYIGIERQLGTSKYCFLLLCSTFVYYCMTFVFSSLFNRDVNEYPFVSVGPMPFISSLMIYLMNDFPSIIYFKFAGLHLPQKHCTLALSGLILLSIARNSPMQAMTTFLSGCSTAMIFRKMNLQPPQWLTDLFKPTPVTSQKSNMRAKYS